MPTARVNAIQKIDFVFIVQKKFVFNI